ncbi:MAG: iron complex outerrane recepter protein [Gammaproteobacteria bacterium]|jgi:outer membrane receptor protein involved in Fe transport|nr:iron complex outerrane recepter protein [Gammaproteobacteria bacterium]
MSLRSVAAVLGAGALLLNSASFADLAAADSSTDANSLSEVVVTAQRKVESAQTVGIALSVVSGQDLANKAITNVVDLQNAIPSLQVEPAFGGGQPQYRIRGVGFLDYTSNNASPIGVSVDDVAAALPIQTAGQLFDINRVEVLRGPQGTLYGRNTTGGQINFITNRPTEETHAGITAEYGSFNEVTAEGFVSGRIAEGLLGRLSVATEQGGGWQRNRDTGQHLGNRDRIAGRGQLEWKPSEIVDLLLEFHLSKDKSDETGLHLLKPYTRTNAAGVVTTRIPADTSRYVTDWNLNPAFAAVTGLNAGAKPGVNNSNNGVDLAANIDVGFAKLTSITAYNKMIRREFSDWDATQFHDSDEYFHSSLDVISQELRIASNGSGRLSWVGGVFYSDQKLDEAFYSDFSDALGGIALTTYEQKANSFGEFGQVNYQFNSVLKATLGVREDHETRELLNLGTGFIVPVVPFTSGLSHSITSNLPSGKIELDYTPQDGTLIYGSISRGVKSGGFTAHNTTSGPATDPFEPEKLTAYEVGIKSDLTRTLRANASAFFYDYRDQQLLGKVFDTVSNSFIGRFVNVPHSRLSGGELEVEWHPVAGLSVSQYAGFVEGYYKSQLLDSSNVDYNGRPESVPKWTYGGDLSYGFNVRDFKITAESNYSFHDTYSQFYLLGSNDYTIPKYWLANANLSLSPASGAPWTLTLWGRNIFNRSYDVTRNFFLPSAEIAQAGHPATFGIRASYQY